MKHDEARRIGLLQREPLESSKGALEARGIVVRRREEEGEERSRYETLPVYL